MGGLLCDPGAQPLPGFGKQIGHQQIMVCPRHLATLLPPVPGSKIDRGVHPKGSSLVLHMNPVSPQVGARWSTMPPVPQSHRRTTGSTRGSFRWCAASGSAAWTDVKTLTCRPRARRARASSWVYAPTPPSMGGYSPVTNITCMVACAFVDSLIDVKLAKAFCRIKMNQR